VFVDVDRVTHKLGVIIIVTATAPIIILTLLFFYGPYAGAIIQAGFGAVAAREGQISAHSQAASVAILVLVVGHAEWVSKLPTRHLGSLPLAPAIRVHANKG